MKTLKGIAIQNQSYTQVPISSIITGVFSSSDVKRLAEESQMMAQFDHPNVMKLLGVSISKSKSLFLVMPFMANGSLLSYLRKNREVFTVENEQLKEVVNKYCCYIYCIFLVC